MSLTSCQTTPCRWVGLLCMSLYDRPHVKLHPAGGWAFCVCLCMTDLMSNYTLQVGRPSVYVSVCLTSCQTTPCRWVGLLCMSLYDRPHVKLHPAGGSAFCVCLCMSDLMSNYTLQVGGPSVYVSDLMSNYTLQVGVSV